MFYFPVILVSLALGCKKNPAHSDNSNKIPVDGLIAYFSFNGDFKDSSGNNNNGNREGVKFAAEINSFEKERDAHQITLEIYQGMGNLKLTLLHSRALQVAKDSIFNIEKNKP